jgi:delta-aminolevulinic acid dehydratase/porphobilinogen synthase
MLERVLLCQRGFILPVLVHEGAAQRVEIPSTACVLQMSVDAACDWLSAPSRDLPRTGRLA